MASNNGWTESAFGGSALPGPRLEQGGAPPARMALPPPGFGEFEVPEMPAYVSGYGQRGNRYTAKKAPLYAQARWGNRSGVGGMGAWLSQAEDPTFLDGFRQKKGNHGVFSAVRWAPGYDWRGGGGISHLAELRNFAGLATRGGQLRKGAPKRSDVVDRPNFWFETARPGRDNATISQNNNNYAGLYESSKRTPVIQQETDALVLREMIEHNPWHISSHGAKAAKAQYDSELGAPPQDVWAKAYKDNWSGFVAPERTVRDTTPYLRPITLADGRPNA
mmetsp:Transcript_11690/g.29698  ORF Transcript_11690/g.29698 Transcript_11690/m.29698 type:complete len:277 (-) Transcript_11690:66-896(-)